MEQKFYYLDGNDQKGPVSIDELKSIGLESNTLVWTKGLDRWKPAREVEELKILMNVPPPLPISSTSKNEKVSPIIIAAVAVCACVILFMILFSTNATVTENQNKPETYNNTTVDTRNLDKLELLGLEQIECKTGFYIAYSSSCTPIVIMKWKNFSNSSISRTIMVKGVFIDNKKGEELSKWSHYFQSYSDAPLQSGLSRQFYLKSWVSYSSVKVLVDADISCQIYINDQLYKTIKIENKELYSDRIQ